MPLTEAAKSLFDWDDSDRHAPLYFKHANNASGTQASTAARVASGT